MIDQIGVSKEIDSLGRLVIPKEMRALFHFETEVELVVTKEGVLIRNPQYELVKRSDDKIGAKQNSARRKFPSGVFLSLYIVKDLCILIHADLIQAVLAFGNGLAAFPFAVGEIRHIYGHIAVLDRLL